MLFLLLLGCMRFFQDLNDRNLQKKYDIARQALQYVCRTLPYGSANKKEDGSIVLDRQAKSKRISLVRNDPQVLKASDTRKEKVLAASASTRQHEFITQGITSEQIKLFKSKVLESGNCTEQARIAFDYIAKQGVFPLELFSMLYGDHAFVVVGRNQATDPLDPTTWNLDAVVCDPWAGEVYFTKDFFFGLNHSAKQRKEIAQSVGFPRPLKYQLAKDQAPLSCAYVPLVYNSLLTRMVHFHSYLHDKLSGKEHSLLNKLKVNIHKNCFTTIGLQEPIEATISRAYKSVFPNLETRVSATPNGEFIRAFLDNLLMGEALFYVPEITNWFQNEYATRLNKEEKQILNNIIRECYENTKSLNPESISILIFKHLKLLMEIEPSSTEMRKLLIAFLNRLSLSFNSALSGYLPSYPENLLYGTAASLQLEVDKKIFETFLNTSSYPNAGNNMVFSATLKQNLGALCGNLEGDNSEKIRQVINQTKKAFPITQDLSEFIDKLFQELPDQADAPYKFWT